METGKTIGFIGGGRVVKIILTAFKKKDILFQDTVVYDPDERVLDGLQELFPLIKTSKNDISAVSDKDLIFLAVHPPVVTDILKSLRPLKPASIFISLVPKFKMDKLSESLNGFSRIVRMIPNAPSCVCKGYNPIVLSDTIQKDDLELLLRILAALGESPIVEEDLLEAYAIITGMGPTYFWPQINKLKELAMSFGIDGNQAEEAIAKMLTGSVTAIFESGLPADVVMDLIPVYPLKEIESQLLEAYDLKLSSLFEKLKS